MNREEAIKQVAENYASQMCKNCSAMLYCEDNNKKCVERREQENVYVDGAKWADNNPDLSSLWHSANEEPEKHSSILIELINTLTSQNEIGYYAEYAEEWVIGTMKTEGFKCRWAYIKDLLPKGGEE